MRFPLESCFFLGVTNCGQPHASCWNFFRQPSTRPHWIGCGGSCVLGRHHLIFDSIVLVFPFFRNQTESKTLLRSVKAHCELRGVPSRRANNDGATFLPMFFCKSDVNTKEFRFFCVYYWQNKNRCDVNIAGYLKGFCEKNYTTSNGNINWYKP